MANPTTNYSWPMPTSADLVTDLPADFAAFGQPVDTSLKALNPETTLGDISYRSATSNTNTRLAIGSTGNVLTVAAGVPTWAAPAGGSTFAGCRATRSASAAISNGTLTALNWDGETFDTDAFHSTSSNTNRITIPSGKAGYYEVNFATEWTDANASGRRLTVIQKNGSDVIGFESTPSSSATLTYYGANVMNLAVADYVSVAVLNTSGSTLNVGTGSYFGITYLGA